MLVKVINHRMVPPYFHETHARPQDFEFVPETLKYWVGVQRGHSYFMGRCLFSLGWPPFYRWYHDKNALWGRCFTWTSFAPHLFLWGWLKLNLTLLLDQLRLA